MQSENTQKTIKKRNELNVRLNEFLLKVDATQKILKKKQEKELQISQGYLKEIVDDLYNFLAQFGYIFFFNLFIQKPKEPKKNYKLFIQQPNKPKKQIPVILQIMLIIQDQVKNQSKVLNQKYEQLQGICELISNYCIELNYLLDMVGLEQMKCKQETTQEHLIKAILSVKKMIQISKNPPKGTKKLSETQRSNKFIQLSRSLLSQVLSFNSSRYTIFLKTLQWSAAILKIQPQTFLQQRILNVYKKIILSKNYMSKVSQKKPCCQIFFDLKTKYYMLKSQTRAFSNCRSLKDMPKIMNKIKQTFLAFLNLRGGIIYVGIKQNRDDIQLLGIKLTADEVLNFFEQVHKLCESIHPKITKDNHNDDEKYKNELEKLRNRSKLEQNSQYVVNKYVAIQFIPIIDPETYEDCYEQTSNGQLKRVYLIRIKVKPGCKFETFYLLKQEHQGEIECYLRCDFKNQKLTQEQSWNLYQSRKKDKKEYDHQKVYEHVQCYHECPILHLISDYMYAFATNFIILLAGSIFQLKYFFRFINKYTQYINVLFIQEFQLFTKFMLIYIDFILSRLYSLDFVLHLNFYHTLIIISD